MPYKDIEKQRESARNTMRKRRANDPQFVEDRKAYMREYRKDNPEAYARKNEVRNSKYSEDAEYRSKTNRENVLKHYRWKPEQYAAKLAEQGGHCALCDSVGAVGGAISLHVDHDHECCDTKFTCGECNRGLLCNACNIRLGYLEAVLRMGSIVPKIGTWLDKALQYLEEYAKETQSTCKA